jgi:glucokinase
VRKKVLSIDIGATKLALAIVNESLSIERKEVVKVSGLNSEQLWSEVRSKAIKLVDGIETALLGIGIGSAGPINVLHGTVSPVNIQIWREFPIVQLLKDLFEVENVKLEGDAIAFTRAEHVIGAGKGLENFLGMVVSTGIGGGLILNNRVFYGESENASFVGHQSINFDAEVCTCGRSGCVEMYASGPSMVANAKKKGWIGGERFEDLAKSAERGDLVAIESIEEGARALSVGVLNTVTGLDIHNVILGGGVIQAGEIFWKPVEMNIEREASKVGFLKGRLKVREAHLGQNAGLIGAAISVLQL